MKKRVYRKDYGDTKLYSVQLSNKLLDGSYDNAFIPVKFKSGVEIEDRADIEILNWFPTFYRKQNGDVVIQMMITDFKQEGKIEKNEEIKEDLFGEFGKEVVIDESDLPF